MCSQSVCFAGCVDGQVIKVDINVWLRTGFKLIWGICLLYSRVVYPRFCLFLIFRSGGVFIGQSDDGCATCFQVPTMHN